MIILLLLSKTVIADRQQKGVAIRSFIIFYKVVCRGPRQTADDMKKQYNRGPPPHTLPMQRVRTGAAGIPPIYRPPNTRAEYRVLKSMYYEIIV